MLSLADGLLVCEDRILIPQNARVKMLVRLHESHQHSSKTHKRAKGAVWWSDINSLAENCEVCSRYQPRNLEQLLQAITLPERPWPQLCIELLEFEKKAYMYDHNRLLFQMDTSQAAT